MNIINTEEFPGGSSFFCACTPTPFSVCRNRFRCRSRLRKSSPDRSGISGDFLRVLIFSFYLCRYIFYTRKRNGRRSVFFYRQAIKQKRSVNRGRRDMNLLVIHIKAFATDKQNALFFVNRQRRSSDLAKNQ